MKPSLIDTTAAVETPERVRFRFRLAGPGQRGLAWLIDASVRAVILSVVMGVILALQAVPGVGTASMGLFLVVAFLLEWVYGAFFETILSGRTPGKLAMSLRVVRDDGAPARFPDFVVRNLLRAADYLPGFFAVGLITMFTDARFRRVGDLVAGTVVVAEERTRVLAQVLIEPPVSEDERQALPPRVDLLPEEVAVIESFLRRRSQLTADRAEELARLFGPVLSERTGVVAPTWERVLTLAYARATGKDR